MQWQLVNLCTYQMGDAHRSLSERRAEVTRQRCYEMGTEVLVHHRT